MPEFPTGPSKEEDYAVIRAREDARRAECSRVNESILARLEPDCNGLALTSKAISMKRIADCLERMEIRRAHSGGASGGVPHAMPAAGPPIPQAVFGRHYTKA